MSALFPMLFSVLAVQCKFLIANFIEHAKSCLFSPYFYDEVASVNGTVQPCSEICTCSLMSNAEALTRTL